MADNSTLPVNGGTEVFANDDIGGVKFPRVKVTWGVDGASVDASASNPLPVTAATLPLPSGAATDAKQDTGNTSLASIDTKVSDVATQTTLAAVLAKIIAAPATEAKQDTANASLDSIDTKMTTLHGYVDGLEALAAAATPAGENHIGQIGGSAANPTANFTRPADTTAYAVGDLVANSTTAGSVVALSFTASRVAAGSFFVRRVKLHKTTTTAGVFRIHFFRAAPSTVTNGDNGAFSVSGAADYLGAFEVYTDQAFTDGSAGIGLPRIGYEMLVKIASGSTIYALIEARSAYTPGNAEVFTVTLDAGQD